jgi:hypothetical protein
MAGRTVDERVADVRRLLAAARAVYGARGALAPAIASSTGLSLEGVELGFECLERDANDADLRSLVAAAGAARRVHVILAANVFVAPLRALALARAAAPWVTVRPSPRDPTVARSLVEACGDDAIAIATERDVAQVGEGEIHVYGRDETVAAVCAGARPGVVVRTHGAGLGAAVVARSASLRDAAEALARDVVLFDQRGCLSPRVALVEGDASRAEAFAASLAEHLGAWDARAPRGDLRDTERAASRAYRDTFAFAGRVFEGAGYAVAFAPSARALAMGPGARHVGVAAVENLAGAAAALAPIAKYLVVVGADDLRAARAVAPPHARVARLGSMQRPPLDGPVDLRGV